jgi:hypothetical protein
MHDIDRTQGEVEEFENGFGGEFEDGFGGEFENGFSGEFEDGFAGEFEDGFAGEFELDQGELEAPMDETQELELASALLEVASEEELDQFLGDVFRAVGTAAGRFARADTGRVLGAILKDTVAKALPVARGALGEVAASMDGTAGGTVAEQAGSLLGLELEGLSPQDQEFESARQVVRLAANAYRHAARAPRRLPPRAAARRAVINAARRYAPGLLRTLRARPGYYRPGRRARPYSYGYGYTRPAPAYAPHRGWPPRRRRYPWWYYRRGYAYPTYPPAYAAPAVAWAGGEEEPAAYGPPTGFGEPAAFGEPAPGAAPGPVAEPAPVMEPPPVGEPAAPAQPPTAGELPGWSGWPPASGVGYPRARSGRWVRRGRVLILYGV